MDPLRQDGGPYLVMTQPEAPDDRTLLSAIAQGDRAALVTLYERHSGVVYSHLVLLTDDHGLSEEILQDTMLAVWRGAGGFRGDSSVRSWIIAIARRQCRDRLRRRRPTLVPQEVLANRPAAEPGPEEQVLGRMAAGAVMTAVGALPRHHREVLDLVFRTGLPLAEIAKILEIPVGTVKSRLFAARAALVRSMPEGGYAS